jgi:hypothetical protein
MTAPFKDFRPELREHTHRALQRIARSKGMTMTALGRQIIEEYVQKCIHDAKIILGQDDDYPDDSGDPGVTPQDDAALRRNGSRR